jgi:hypothetical protein
LIVGGTVHALAFDDPSEAISIHGFISQGYLLSDTNDVYAETTDGSFQFNEFGLTFLVQLSDRLHTGMQVLSRDLGDIGNNTVEMDWAFADYRWRDWLGFRGGILKIPWGIYNETRDIDMLRTSIFLPSSLYGEEVRDVYDAMQGIALYGSFPLWKLGTLNYQLQYGDKSISGDYADMDFWDEAGGPQLDSLDVSDIYLGMLEWETPIEGLRLRETTGEYAWKMRGTYFLPIEMGGGQIPLLETGRQIFAIASADYTRERLSLAAEWFGVWNDADEEEFVEPDADQEGWYVGLSYRVTDWLELGTYYSEFYGDGDDKDGDDWVQYGLPAYLAWQKDLAITTRFDIGEQWTIKLEGHLMDGAARLPASIQNIPEQETILFAVKTTFNF